MQDSSDNTDWAPAEDLTTRTHAHKQHLYVHCIVWSDSAAISTMAQR